MIDNVKLRKLLILFHLFGAAFMAPAFALVSITGGLYLVGGGEKVVTESFTLPQNAVLDFKSPTLDADLRELLDRADVDFDFSYIKNRGTKIQTRPTSRTYIEMSQSPSGLTATINKPNFQKAMMEIHKGHGPKILRHYHKLVALVLLLVVFGGIIVGILAKAYRRKTITAAIIGTFLYVGLIMFGN